jgi:hypothetical protein
VLTAQYAVSSNIKQIRSVFKGLIRRDVFVSGYSII